MKRLITEKEEQAYRLVHHDFEGLTPQEAAARMDITPQALSNLLRNVKRKAPQLFPILTPPQKLVCDLIHAGYTRYQLARHLGKTLKQVDNIIQQLHKKSFAISLSGGTVTYQDWMDNQIKEKF